jgi:glycine/D-amino acid oxidase-like deaminating enzyme
MERDHTLTRRECLSAALVGLLPKSEKPIAGGFVDRSHEIGHRMRDRAHFARPQKTKRVPLVIVGGGIAGLSAAWQLDRRGFRDFVLLEMESQAGGNSRWGENEITPYPWAAHYVPVPGRKTTLVRELFAELGLLEGDAWNERYLCHSPQERLHIHGRWQPGLIPETGLTTRDREQFHRFDGLIAEMRSTGQFTIPAATGAKPSPLDGISMQHWMTERGLDSPYLNWYVDYACRDDYGALARDTSAWAGVHYFASREHEEQGPLTWPEGNGWIVRRLLGKLARYILTGTAVWRIEKSGTRYRVLTEKTEYLADCVIFAAPTFLARYLIDTAPPIQIEYSPWLTANLTLDRWPAERGFPAAWDNVIYGSPSLGYVVATHQSLRTHIDRTVLTYYWALASGTPSANRRALLDRDWNWWKEAILNDLAHPHPDIRNCVSRIDIMRLGHAMARPVPGSIFADDRRRLNASSNRLLFAHSDLSGFSIFEEAQYRGVAAADGALAVNRGATRF